MPTTNAVPGCNGVGFTYVNPNGGAVGSALCLGSGPNYFLDYSNPVSWVFTAGMAAALFIPKSLESKVLAAAGVVAAGYLASRVFAVSL
jgi:hypothetical protein